MQSMAPRIVRRKSGHEVIAYGALTQRKTASGGSVETVLDNAYELERNLQTLDPQAEISLTDRNR
jgi:hypothetical protein